MQRAAIAQQLMKFVTSPQFRNRIEEIVQASSDLQTMVQDEARAHYKLWKKRLQLYKTIYKTIEWDGSMIPENLLNGLRFGFSRVHVVICLLVRLFALRLGICIRTEFLNGFAKADRIRSGHLVFQGISLEIPSGLPHSHGLDCWHISRCKSMRDRIQGL